MNLEMRGYILVLTVMKKIVINLFNQFQMIYKNV